MQELFPGVLKLRILLHLGPFYPTLGPAVLGSQRKQGREPCLYLDLAVWAKET